MASNDPSIRTEFFLRLNEARPVDSLGRYMNNRGRRLADLHQLREAMSEARFNIAFENRISPGYVTEKLVNPLFAGSVPIYWGAPEANTDFNPDAFVNAGEFASFDELVRHVIWLDDNPTAVAEIASAPVFIDNKVPYQLTPTFVIDHIERSLSSAGADYVPQKWIDAFGRAADARNGQGTLRRILNKISLLRSALSRIYALFAPERE